MARVELLLYLLLLIVTVAPNIRVSLESWSTNATSHATMSFTNSVQPTCAYSFILFKVVNYKYHIRHIYYGRTWCRCAWIFFNALRFNFHITGMVWVPSVTYDKA